MKKILGMWIVVAVLMVGTLTYVGFKLTENNKIYKEAENNLKEAAEGYAGYYPNILKNNLIIKNEELIEKGFNKEIKVYTEKCDGYVLIKRQGVIYKYKPYIKCKEYTTKGYKSQK